ncbi:unnamed protein product [Candidula unifasciata]|uniref:Uncharacterized protein n=1 Tax=Candidula unifasciata TaxID=100452 RepID=A0A8S3YDB0_9EUPU|nr:unnamed protein product [Candidula unifasciata]
MCPQTELSVYERQPSLSQVRCPHTMIHAVRSVFLQGDHNPGLDCMNLPSIDVTERYNTISIEHAFSHMKIDGERLSCHQDSDKDTSHCDGSCMSPDDVSSETVCETGCMREDISLRNDSHFDDILRDSETCGGKLTHIIESLFEGDQDGDNSLHLSIINGYKSYSRLLINLAPDFDCLNLSNNLRQTPLHLAVLTRQPDIVRRLVCAGAAVLAQDQQGNTPLHLACGLGDKQSVKHLLTPVFYEETLENKYSIPYQRIPQDLRIRNYEGQTCLHIAVSARNFKVVQMLIDTGADINVGDGRSGRSVLHLAADTGDTEMVEMLLSTRGIQINTRDFAGFTPAQLAYGRSHTETARLLYSITGHYDGTHVDDAMLEDNAQL